MLVKISAVLEVPDNTPALEIRKYLTEAVAYYNDHCGCAYFQQEELYAHRTATISRITIEPK